MRNQKSNGRKIMERTAVVSAVFILAAMTTMGLSGCQNAAKKETEVSVKNIRAEAGAEPTDMEGSSAERTDNEQSGTELSDTGDSGSTETDQQIQSMESDLQARSEQSTAQTLPDNNETMSGDEKTERKEPPEGWELTLASEDWGLSFGEPGTQPGGNASAQDLAWYNAYYVGADSEKVIYLTFDCGYENGNTELILDALKKHDVKATFFVVGHFLETAPEMAKRMVEDGHAVGNHTYHHLDMPTISDEETFRKELDDVANLFQEITGAELSTYYRPPQGKCNADNLKMAYELGYKTVFWSLAYVDWDQDKQPSHEEAFDKLTTRVHPGAVVLLHNTSSTNGEILDELLTKWEAMGYTFKPLSELTGE